METQIYIVIVLALVYIIAMALKIRSRVKNIESDFPSLKNQKRIDLIERLGKKQFILNQWLTQGLVFSVIITFAMNATDIIKDTLSLKELYLGRDFLICFVLFSLTSIVQALVLLNSVKKKSIKT